MLSSRIRAWDAWLSGRGVARPAPTAAAATASRPTWHDSCAGRAAAGGGVAVLSAVHAGSAGWRDTSPVRGHGGHGEVCPPPAALPPSFEDVEKPRPKQTYAKPRKAGPEAAGDGGGRGARGGGRGGSRGSGRGRGARSMPSGGIQGSGAPAQADGTQRLAKVRHAGLRMHAWSSTA
eukprot:365232-Chlamydomonas_euryale.AAC.11